MIHILKFLLFFRRSSNIGALIPLYFLWMIGLGYVDQRKDKSHSLLSVPSLEENEQEFSSADSHRIKILFFNAHSHLPNLFLLPREYYFFIDEERARIIYMTFLSGY
ncbi:hypothetical protein CH370_20915 [Leptospira kmetyi]|uniref:Uncharacterized protein n=1 Tax=Leptospira kmetyi TaxID=408139 RepID=A0ABX4NBI2_9LEPT|nr:hypothetical protein CH378_16395 [Leptospira kmetyi]PJZ39519.1 hypothetical protein CH370_20915 [Leptospira kmetyi]